jgi:hypothetical protein
MDHRGIRSFRLILVITLAAAPTLRGQTPAKRTPEQIQASYAAHKGEFDYLLGDWEFTATSQQYGKFHGLWSAVRPDKGQILDEYRVVGDALGRQGDEDRADVRGGGADAVDLAHPVLQHRAGHVLMGGGQVRGWREDVDDELPAA